MKSHGSDILNVHAYLSGRREDVRVGIETLLLDCEVPTSTALLDRGTLRPELQRPEKCTANKMKGPTSIHCDTQQVKDIPRKHQKKYTYLLLCNMQFIKNKDKIVGQVHLHSKYIKKNLHIYHNHPYVESCHLKKRF